jgi:L-alanine-DL-glutamate epimerase-like enolase superfamily enzyme
MSELKIARVDVFKADLPYSGGVYHLSGGREYMSFDATFVRITTNTGIEGWGESIPFASTFIAAHALGVRAGIAEIAPWLIGLDPRRVDRINETMDAALVGHEHDKTPLDIACRDIFGKLVGMPVCELLGGRTNV